jgi:hypothetical protein
MDAFTLDPTQISDLSRRLLDDRGRPCVVPARELETTSPEERLLFGVRHGLYGFLTLELVDFLRAHRRAQRHRDRCRPWRAGPGPGHPGYRQPPARR